MLRLRTVMSLSVVQRCQDLASTIRKLQGHASRNSIRLGRAVALGGPRRVAACLCSTRGFYAARAQSVAVTTIDAYLAFWHIWHVQ
jgi:hypothetical protein